MIRPCVVISACCLLKRGGRSGLRGGNHARSLNVSAHAAAPRSTSGCTTLCCMKVLFFFAGVSQAPSVVTNPRAAMNHAAHEASTRLQRRQTARVWSDFILGLLVSSSAQIAKSWRDLTLSLLANLAQTWRTVVHHFVHGRPPWMLDWLAALPLRLVTRMRARRGLGQRGHHAVPGPRIMQPGGR